MSFDLIGTTEFNGVAFQDVLNGDLDNDFEDELVIGGILSDSKHVWHAKGSCLEVRNIQTTYKLGSWRFGANIPESSIKITAVEELKRSKGPLPLLVIALNCSVNQGIISIFDIFGSKVLRTVHITQRITSLHVIESDGDRSIVLDSSPLRYFDGIVAVGTHGGDVFLVDICKDVCESVIENMDATVRDELNPCQMVILRKYTMDDIKKYVERSVEREEHLAIHLNVAANNSTEHFILKGENGDDIIHVDRTELEVSSLFYSARMASLLVGYNFGAFQAWNLRSLNLIYTSPICEGNIPITHFTTQEPADDPKAYCYIWVSYSHNHLFHSGLPFAVMYSFFFDRKIFLNGYGNIYEDFQNCSIRFQLELGDTQSSTCSSPVKGGLCLGFQSLNKCISSKDQSTVALCFISWLFWDASEEVNTAFLLFDLNQWYKEQMPRVPRWSHCSNYLIRNSVGELLFDIKIDQKSLVQFMGLQRLEQHFCPTALSFDVQGLTQNAILKFHNKSMQRLFLDKIADSEHLALLRPDHFCEQIFTLGLTPLFSDYPSLNSSLQLDDQREFLLSVALEQRLVGWLCQAATKLANNAFSSTGLTIYNILNWAFHRAIVLKNSLYQYCVPLFDYSGTRLDDNTLTMLLAGTNQMRNLCSLYRYVSNKLIQFVADGKQLLDEQRSLEHLVTYFEVVLWMTNVGLLPECQPRSGILFNLVSAPYLIDDLKEYYNNKREQLQLASKETFVEKDCLLFIDNMVNNQTEGELIRQQWQEDGGTGLYPPPSLQSVLRIYLLDGLDVTFKHSFVTYTLLDIAMTVDEHNKVVKLLLKFPQIFNLSQSIIKIVQAFWHLDHDDYETALESILDPSVLAEDLQPWHHSAMMRSLLMQNQSGLALLYLQIRKPPIQEEKDLLTVVSLLISKNMLDEAFKFRDQHKGTADESALLTHIFNECNKNELLHTLLYRRLSTAEEKAFFKYLQENRNPKYDDLQIFYYLLRSRFLEAFDSYSLSKRKQPSAQGLIGQRDASTTDNVVKMFKNLLPDVNRNLVETVRKERTNLWKEVPRPTPFSVFVHNPKDQVHYKSSIIFAALSKAQQTFNDAADRTGVETEQTPFLRTPRMFIRKSVQNTPVLKCRVVEQKITGEEYGPSPSKKFRLSPRAPMATPMKKKMEISNSVQSNFHTPIVKRRRKSCETTNTPAILPQSILKTRTFLEDSLMNDDSSTNPFLKLDCENSVAKARFALTPRKAIRTPLKSHVTFDDLHCSTNSEASKGKSLSPREDTSTSLPRISTTTSVETNDFYCPNLALEEQENVIAGKCSTPLVNSKSLTRTDQKVFGQLPEATVNIAVKAQIPIEENDLSTNRFNYQSPKARRSYKRSFGENVGPVRTSPRLAKKLPTQEASTTSPSKIVQSAKLKPRKSLSRSVLEHNAFSKLTADDSIFKDTSRSNETVQFSFSSVSSESINLDTTNSLVSDLSFGEVSNNAGTSFTSKTTEVRSMEVSRTSVQSNRTGHLMGLNDSRKYDSKTVFTDEEVETNKAQIQEDGNRTSTIAIDEELSNSTVSNSIGDISTQEQGSYSKDSQENALEVYEDLSSGSEDMREVLQGINDKKVANKQIDPSSTSKRNTEHEFEAILADTLEIVDYDIVDSVLSANYDCQEPPHEQSFGKQSNVIEISSSSEDELNYGQILQTDEETSFRLHIATSSNRSPVVANEFEEYEITLEENNSHSRIDLENNEETHNSDKYERGSICIESSREDEDCPEEFAVVQLHAHLEKQHVSIADDTFDESNKEITPYSTADKVTADKELTKTLEKCDESTDEDNSVYESPNRLHNSGFEVSELVLEKPDDPSTDSNKHSISIQCTLAAKDLESSNSDEAPRINNIEECEELSEHQRSISVQCTLRETDAISEQSVQVEESSPEMLKLRTVKKTYKKCQALMDTTSKLAAHETLDSLSLPVEAQGSTSEPQRSTGMHDDNPVEDVESDEEIRKDDINTSEMVLKTVKKSYKGPKSLLDATPKLAVSLTSRKYSRKTKVNLFGGSNTEKLNDNLTSMTADRDIVVTDDKPDNYQENKVTEETDHKKLVDAERVSDIAKTIDTSTTKTFEATTNLSILTKKTYSENTDGGECSENDSVNAVPLEKKLTLKQSSLILGDKAKPESKAGKTPTSKPTNLVIRKSTRRSQHEPVASSASVGSAVSKRITTRRNSAIQSDDARIITEDSTKVSPPKIRRTRRLISDFNNPDAFVDLDDCQERDSRRDTKVVSALTDTAKTSKTTRKTSTAHLPIVDDVQLVSDKPRRRKRSHDSEETDTVQDASIEDPPMNEGASTSKDVLSGSARKGKSKAASQISTYSMSRRLTRLQASMLESMSVENEIGNIPIMEEIDPVQLLDKPEFKGKQDPDEAKVYERSPSTGSESSRQTRSSSVFSQNLVGVTTPKRTRAERAWTSGAKSKKTPIDLVAPKRSDDMVELEQNTVKRAGLRRRSRTNSVSSVQSDNSDVSNSSARTTRSRSSRIVKTQLPEIEEEKMIEDASAKPAKKVGRKIK